MSFRRQKLSNAAALGTTSIALLLLLCLAALVFLRSLIEFQPSFFSRALPLDSLPLFVALNPHLVNQVQGEDISRVLRFNSSSRSSGSGGAQSQFGNGTTEDDVEDGLRIWDWELANRTSEQRGEEGGADLRELLNILAPTERRKWMKQHWSDVDVFRSDAASANFSTRIHDFFKPSSEVEQQSDHQDQQPHDQQNQQRACFPKFFTIWIAPLSSFQGRELLCLLSIFKQHPGACVVILSRSIDSSQGRAQLIDPLVARGYRITAISPDLPHLFSNTPAHTWLSDLRSGRIDPGEISFRQNLSNILRLVALYKYGGIYVDSDVVVLRSMADLRNVIGAQSQSRPGGAAAAPPPAPAGSARWLRVNNAVLVFDRRHPLLRGFIREFALTFNGSKWGHNGPYLATRVLTRMDKLQRIHEPVAGYRVLPVEAFYPVNWVHIPRLFARHAADEEWRAAKLAALFNGSSYTLHLWNKQTGKLRIERGSVVDSILRWVAAADQRLTL